MLSERSISGSCVRRRNPRLQATRKKPRAPEPERLGGNPAAQHYQPKGEITMYHQTLIGRSLQAALRCSLLFLLGLTGSFAHASAPAQEQALTWTARDEIGRAHV